MVNILNYKLLEIHRQGLQFRINLRNIGKVYHESINLINYCR